MDGVGSGARTSQRAMNAAGAAGGVLVYLIY
jgi:hypothetical protein